MNTEKNTGFNNISTQDQNYLCLHWAEARRSLEILTNLIDDAEADAAVLRVVADGERAVRVLQKGQTSRRRALRTRGSHEAHH